MVLEKVKQMIADQLEITTDEIAESSNFEDLNADSLDVLQIAMGLEKEYGIVFTDDEIMQIKSVGDVVRFIEAHK